MSVPAQISTVVARLTAAGCVAAEEEARELLVHAPNADIAESWIARREQGEPLAWITGTQDFCGRPIRVDPGVYVPRPQSEELARRAGELLRRAGGSAADLCTGSGAVAAQLLDSVPGARVVGVDIDEAATACARRNGVPTILGELADPLESKAFDLATAVAPYVPTSDLRTLPRDVQRWEPQRALDGGDDGLDLVRDVVVGAARILRPGGWLLVELGGDQDRVLAPLLTRAGFDRVTTWYDSEDDLRGLAARLSVTAPGSASG